MAKKIANYFTGMKLSTANLSAHVNSYRKCKKYRSANKIYFYTVNMFSVPTQTYPTM